MNEPTAFALCGRAVRDSLIVTVLAAAFVPRVSASPSKADSWPTSATVASPYAIAGSTRTFSITYVAKISGVPKDAHRLRIWLPVPRDSASQTIRDLHFSAQPELTYGRKYGNEFAYWEITRPSSVEEVKMSFTCTRREIRTNLEQLAAAKEDSEMSPQFAVFRQPDRLVVVDEPIRKLAEEITAGRGSTLEKAYGIYDFVLAHMRYDKTGAGWGTGSTAFACANGRGNCTDFHSLFNSLCRAVGVASEFEIGLFLPYERGAQESVGGYHCWASFRVPGRSWVPVDCSEGWREPQRRDYFFGDLTANRVTLSVGRDLTLEPAQAGSPLNFFVEPYAEADDQPVSATKTWSYTDSN